MNPPSSPEAPLAPRPEVSENVTRLLYGEKELFLVGAAHVSQKSVEEVRHLVTELRPDTVCVELDTARYETLADETRWRRFDVTAVLQGDRAGLFLASLLFSGFQKRIGERLGVLPGSEMLAAVEEARRIGAEVVLADREIQTTLWRCYKNLGLIDRAKIAALLAMLPFAASDIDEAEVERLKSREHLGDAMEGFARQMPRLKTPLIDERDQYLIASVREAPGRRIVAVVGAAHIPGMTRLLEAPIDRDALMALPGRSAGERALGFVIPALAWTLIALAASRGATAVTGVALALAIPAATATALLALLAGAGLLPLLAAMVLAPLAVVLPGVPVGRAAGLLQSRLSPGTPDEGATLRADVLSPARARRNRMIRAALVAVFVTFGRRGGAVVGLGWAAVRLLG